GGIVEGAVSGVVDTIGGAGTLEKFKTSAYETFQQAQDFGHILQTQPGEKEIVKFIRDKNYDHADISKATGNFIKDVAKETSLSGNPPSVLEKIKSVNPIYYYLASKLGDF